MVALSVTEKKPSRKKNHAFSPDGPNRARLRHAAVAADERVPSYFVGGNPRSRPIIVSLSLSLSPARREKTAEKWAASLGHREKL